MLRDGIFYEPEGRNASCRSRWNYRLMAVWAADPFAGDWKLNPAKSEFKDKVKAGRVLIEADNAGGYRQLYEIIFETAPRLRLTSRSQFDGTPEDDTLDGQDVRYTSRRIDANAFEITYRDRDTDRVSRTVRFSAEPHDHTLTVLPTGARRSSTGSAKDRCSSRGRASNRRSAPEPSTSTASACRPASIAPGKIEPKEGGVNGAFYGPDGARLYNLGGPAAESRSFGLEAPVAGIYKIALRSATAAAKSFTLRVESIIPADKRVPAAPANPPKEKFHQPAHRRVAQGGGRRKSRCGGGLLARDRKGRRADFRAARRQRPRHAGDVPVARHAVHAQCA